MKSKKKGRQEDAPRGKVILLVRRAEVSVPVSEGTHHQGREFLQQNGFLSVQSVNDSSGREKPGHVSGLAPWQPRNFIVLEYQEDEVRQMYMDFQMFLVSPRSKKLIERGKIPSRPVRLSETKEELWLKGNKEENCVVEAETVPEAMKAHLARFAEGNANVQHIEAVDLDAFELPEDQKEEKEEPAELSEDAHQLHEDLAPVSMKDMAVTAETVKRFSRAPTQPGIYGAKLKFMKPAPAAQGSLAAKDSTWLQKFCERNRRVAQFINTYCGGVHTIMAISNAMKKMADEGKRTSQIADIIGETDFMVYLFLHLQELHKDVQPFLELHAGALSPAVADVLRKVEISLQPKVWNEIKGYAETRDMIRKVQQYIKIEEKPE